VISRGWLGCQLALAALIAGCRPTTIAEAERRGDVAWLDQNGTPNAVAAIGRLADRNPSAVSALEARSAFDMQAFRAAWFGALRGAPWATAMMHAGFGDPKRADLAASAVDRGEARLVMFLPDLEGALVRLSATTQNLNVSGALASMGPPAHEVIARRITDASTRAAMCRGIASKDAAADARRVLFDAPEGARDSAACVDAVVRIAADDDLALGWLAEQGEPGILGAAGKEDVLPCARLHVAWTKALAARVKGTYSALTVPLSYAVKRCPAEMDGVLADAIVHLPATRVVVVQAIDPFEGYGGSLHATCAALPMVAAGSDTAMVKERAGDALMHACKAPG
jgi:hypothetical protein